MPLPEPTHERATAPTKAVALNKAAPQQTCQQRTDLTWRSSASSDRARARWTSDYVAGRERVHGAREGDGLADVDALADAIVSLFGVLGSVRFMRRLYGAVMTRVREVA